MASIVDYLNSQKQDSSFAARQKLATQYGINGYQGTAAQNTQLLGLLQTPKASPTTATPTGEAFGPQNPNLAKPTNNNVSMVNNYLKSFASSGNGAAGGGGGSWGADQNSLFSVSRPGASTMTTNGAGMQVPTATNNPGTGTSAAIANIGQYGPYKPDFNSKDITGLAQDAFGGSTGTMPTVNLNDVAPTANPSVNIPSTISTDTVKKANNVNLPNENDFVTPKSSITDVYNSVYGNNNGADQAEYDKLSKDILSNMDTMGTMSARKLALEKEAGLQDYKKQLNDINAQLITLNAEAQKAQLDSQGKPIANVFINRQVDAIEREKTIKALGLNAVAATLQGNIALGNDIVEKALSAEFDPIKAKVEYLKTALEMNKDKMSREEKQKATLLEVKLKEWETGIDNYQKEKKNIYDVMLKAAENGASAQTINAIREAKTSEDAIKIAGSSLSKSGNGGLTTVQQSAAFKLADDYEKASGDLSKVISSYNKVSAAASDPSAAGDISLVFAYMKMLDPSSVVREGEFATAQNATGVPQQLQNTWNKLQNGERLSNEQRKDFLNQSSKLYQAALEQQKNVDKTFTGRANQWGVPPELVIRSQSSYLDSSKSISDPSVKGALDWIDSAAGGGFKNAQSEALNGSTVGKLSERYESGGNPGAIGYDSTGGWSYGTYQLAHNNANNFINQSPYKQYFQGIAFNSPAWRSTWQQVAKADPQGFANAQKEYIAKTHFEPQINKLASIGVDISKLNPAVQNVIWSTAVQHGANNSILTAAAKRANPMTNPQEFIKDVYALRWNGGSNFASSTPEVRKSVYNRFFGANGELANALKMNQTYA